MCIHYFCATCHSPFIGEGAIEPCADQYTLPPDQRDNHRCPSNNLKYCKREEGEHLDNQPCPGPPPPPLVAEPAVRGGDHQQQQEEKMCYVQPGELWGQAQRKRTAAWCGQSYYGQAIAKANIEGENQAESGTLAVSEEHRRRGVGGETGVVYPVDGKSGVTAAKRKRKVQSKGPAKAKK